MKGLLYLLVLHVQIRQIMTLTAEERKSIYTCKVFEYIYNKAILNEPGKSDAQGLKIKCDEMNHNEGLLREYQNGTMGKELIQISINIDENSAKNNFVCIELSIVTYDDEFNSELDCYILNDENESTIIKAINDYTSELKELFVTADPLKLPDDITIPGFDNKVISLIEMAKNMMSVINNTVISALEDHTNQIVSYIASFTYMIDEKTEKAFKLCKLDTQGASDKHINQHNSFDRFYYICDSSKAATILSFADIDQSGLINVKIFSTDDFNMKVIFEGGDIDYTIVIPKRVLNNKDVSNELNKMYDSLITDYVKMMINEVKNEGEMVTYTFNTTSLAIFAKSVMNGLKSVTLYTEEANTGQTTTSLITTTILYGSTHSEYIDSKTVQNLTDIKGNIYQASEIRDSPIKDHSPTSPQLLSIGNVNMDVSSGLEVNPVYTDLNKRIEEDVLYDFIIKRFMNTNYVQFLVSISQLQSALYIELYDMNREFNRGFLIRISTLFRQYEYILPRVGQQKMQNIVSRLFTKIISRLNKQIKKMSESSDPVPVNVDRIKAYLIAKFAKKNACILKGDGDSELVNFSIFIPKKILLTSEEDEPIVIEDPEITIQECLLDEIAQKNKMPADYQKIVTMNRRKVDNHIVYRISFSVPDKSNTEKPLEQGSVENITPNEEPHIISTSFEFNLKYDHEHTPEIFEDIDAVLPVKVELKSAVIVIKIEKTNIKYVLMKKKKKSLRNLQLKSMIKALDSTNDGFKSYWTIGDLRIMEKIVDVQL